MHIVFLISLIIAGLASGIPVGGPTHESPDPKNGFPWNPKHIIAIRVFAGVKTDATYFEQKLKQYGAYCPSKTPAEMKTGALIVMGTVLKLRSLPAATFGTCTEDDTSIDQPNSCFQKAGHVYGMLRKAALKEDATTIRQILKQHQGSTLNLKDKWLVKLWGYNEHQHLHDTLCHPDAHTDPLPPLTAADKIFHGVHITSLSDGIKTNAYWGTRVSSELGGANNAGTWPERNWFESAKAYPELFPEAFQ